MVLEFLEPRSRIYPGAAIARRPESSVPANAYSGVRCHGIPEYETLDDEYDYDLIPSRRLPDKSGPSRLRTAFSCSTISSHVTAASTSSSSSSSSDLDPPYPPTPSYSSECLPDARSLYPSTPSSGSRPSLEFGDMPVFDVSPLRPKRKEVYGRTSGECTRSDDSVDDRPPVYAQESPRSMRRPLPLPPQSPTRPRRPSVVRPLPMPAVDPPPYTSIQPLVHDRYRRSIRPLPRLPQPQPAAETKPHTTSPPQSSGTLAQEPWASAEEGLRQVPTAEVIDWDAVEAAMLSADSDEDSDEDSDSTIGPPQ